MDPQTALFNLLDAIDRNDRDAVDIQLAALAEWNAKGGFLPAVTRIVNADATFAVARTVRRAYQLKGER